MRLLRHVRGISHDGNSILYEPVKDEDLLSVRCKQRKIHEACAAAQAEDLLSGARFSPDEKWVAFHSMEGSTKNHAGLDRAREPGESGDRSPDGLRSRRTAAMHRIPAGPERQRALFHIGARRIPLLLGATARSAERRSRRAKRLLCGISIRRANLCEDSRRKATGWPFERANRLVFSFPELTGKHLASGDRACEVSRTSVRRGNPSSQA